MVKAIKIKESHGQGDLRRHDNEIESSVLDELTRQRKDIGGYLSK